MSSENSILKKINNLPSICTNLVRKMFENKNYKQNNYT